MTITFEPLNDAGRRLMVEHLEMLVAHTEALRADVNRLGMLVKELLDERARIVDVLSAFYRSDITMSSLQPLCDLATELNPALRTEPRR